MRATTVLLFCATLLVAARAAALDASKLEFERTVEDVTAPGLYRVAIDPELYRHARAADLADLRIAGPDNAEIPWLVRRLPAAARPEPRAVTVVATVALADGSSRAVLDFGAPGRKHSEVTLDVDGDGDWFRKTIVESSNDANAWTRLAAGAWLFRVSVAGRAAAATRLAYPTSEARYLRVTLLPPASPSPPGAPLRIRGASAAFVPPEAHVPLRLLPSVKPQPVPEPAAAKTSAWTLDLGAAGVPLAELALDVTDPAFARSAVLGASRDARSFTPLAATLLYRVAPDVAGRLAEENVRLPAGRTRARWLRLTVYDGDAPPLSLRSISPAYVAEELVFRAPAAGAYTLYVGGDVPAPQYALADELARSDARPTRTATLGSVTPNPAYDHLGAPPPRPPSSGTRYELPLGLALALLLAVIALWTLRFVRRART